MGGALASEEEPGEASVPKQPGKLQRQASAPEIPSLMKRLANVFDEIDTAGSDAVDKPQMMKILQDEAIVDRVISVLDTNQDGKISFSEFSAYHMTLLIEHGIDRVLRDIDLLEERVTDCIVADDAPPPAPTLQRTKSNGQSMVALSLRMSSIFERIDNNGNGMIEKSELEKTLGNVMHAGYLLKEMDTVDKDGQVSPVEWNMYFIKVYNEKGKDSVAKMLNNLEAKLAEAES